MRCLKDGMLVESHGCPQHLEIIIWDVRLLAGQWLREEWRQQIDAVWPWPLRRQMEGYQP